MGGEHPRRLDPRFIDVERLFGDYVIWLNERLSEQWETIEVSSSVEDFGRVEWNGRPLDAVIARTNIKQRNRIKGEYQTGCFLFGLVDDAEFSMERDPFAFGCENVERGITMWKVRRQFKSTWNWEPESFAKPAQRKKKRKG